MFGRYAERIQQRAAGIDDRPVLPDVEEEQISAEETFDTDIADHARLRANSCGWRTACGARLRERRLAASCVTVKIRRGDFTTYTRQRHIEPPTQETRVVTRVAVELLDAWLAAQPRAALRLLGVGVSRARARDAARPVHGAGIGAATGSLDAAVDRMRERFGGQALRRPVRCRTAGRRSRRTRNATRKPRKNSRSRVRRA